MHKIIEQTIIAVQCLLGAMVPRSKEKEVCFCGHTRKLHTNDGCEGITEVLDYAVLFCDCECFKKK